MNKNIGDMTNDELKDFIIELQEENSRYERKIDKAVEKLYCWGEALNADFQQEMLKILKRWENEMDQR